MWRGIRQSAYFLLLASSLWAQQSISRPDAITFWDGQKATYSASTTAFTPVAGDIACLPGSASKTIRLTVVEASISTSGTAALETLILVKRSAADTAGTSAAITAVPHDSNNAAASAAPLQYTAAPTPGAAVGQIRGGRLIDSSAATTGQTLFRWTFGSDAGSQAIVLRGVAQEVCANIGAVVATQTAIVTFQWTEE